MQQVLFFVPFTSSVLPPDGLPLYGFGATLFLVFLVAAMVWGPRRGQKVGMPREKFTDMCIALFIAGISGARILYMIQYSEKFPNTIGGLLNSFFKIWEGGIVFYGSAIGGVIGFLVFYRLVIRKFKVDPWRLADACAPVIALGLAIGRIGCYLNGCCWGQVALPECQTVPLSASLGEFPLLSCPARDQVIYPPSTDERLPAICGLQTSTGFTIDRRPSLAQPAVQDPRTLVMAIEPGSAASKAGLKPGDRIVKINGLPNRFLLDIAGAEDSLKKVIAEAKASGAQEDGKEKSTRVSFDTFEDYKKGVYTIRALNEPVLLTGSDTFGELVRQWPRGRNDLELQVDRGGSTIDFRFTPRTISFFPTQLYETVSMVLLMLLLLAFQPYRRHNGQMIVVMMLGYALHRFLNEAIRIEPTYAGGLTLSQWISVGIFVAALGLELFLRKTQPKLGAGLHPLGGEACPPTAGKPAAKEPSAGKPAANN